MSEMDTLLSGFEIVDSDSVPSVTLDKQLRFYINTSARRLLSAKPYKRMALAYNPQEKSIAFIMNVPPSMTNAATSNYNVDKRYYMPAKHFARRYGFSEHNAPYTFVYDNGSSDGRVFIFRLAEA